MSFATLKLKSELEKWMLIRMSYSHLGDWTLHQNIGGTSFIYKRVGVDKAYFVGRTSSGVALTEVFVLPTGNNEWYYDASVSTLYIRISSTAVPANGNFFSKSYIYLTGGKHRFHYFTPSDPLTDVVEWVPRIDEYPEITQSQINVLDGVFSVNEFQFSIMNPDDAFSYLRNLNVSAVKQECKIWLGISDGIETEVTGILDGIISGSQFDSGRITFSVKDFAEKLNIEALFDADPSDPLNTRDRSYAYADAINQINISYQSASIPIPIHFGFTTPMDLNFTSRFAIANPGYPMIPLTEIMPEAISIGTSLSLTGWTTGYGGAERILGRIAGTLTGPSFPTATFDGPNFGNVTTVGIGGDWFGAPGDDIDWGATGHYYCFAGDTIKYNDGLVSRYGHIVKCASYLNFQSFYSGYSGSDIEVFLDNQGGGFVYPESGPGCSLSAVFSPTVWTVNGSGDIIRPCAAIRDFTHVVNPAPYGNVVGVRFKENYQLTGTSYIPADDQTGFGISSAVNANATRVKFRISQVYTDNSDRSFKIMQDIINLGALSSVDADFLALTDKRMLFSVPFIGSTTYPTYLDLLAKIAANQLCVFYQNTDFEIGVKEVTFPISGSSMQLTAADIIRGSFIPEVRYDDCYTRIVGDNIHSGSKDRAENVFGLGNGSLNPDINQLNREFSCLNGFQDKQLIFSHLFLERDDVEIKHYSNPRIYYRFQTSSINLDSNIGDKITIEHPGLLNGATSQDCMILEITKGVNTCSIVASPFIEIEPI